MGVEDLNSATIKKSEIKISPAGQEVSSSERVAETFLQEAFESDELLSHVKLSEKGIVEGLLGLKIAEDFKSRDGVIDAKMVFGCPVVVYNCNQKIPEGCPDLRLKRRAGQFNPEEGAVRGVVYVDLADSWSFLNDKYEPESLSGVVSHELRHYLVRLIDGKIKERTGQPEIDRADHQETEEYYQRSYLDELHAQFTDYVSGRIQPIFESPDSISYSGRGSGKHWELASDIPEVQSKTRDLVTYLQAFILLNELGHWEDGSLDMNDVVYRVGAILVISRSVNQALTLLHKFWQDLIRKEDVKLKLKIYLDTYRQNVARHTPALSDKLKLISLGN